MSDTGGFGEKLLLTSQTTNLWLSVNFRVHLRADEGEQAHPVSLSKQVLLAVSHAEDLVLHHFSCYEGGSGESQSFFQDAV